MTGDRGSTYRDLQRHLTLSWPDRPQHDETWSPGPVGEALPGFHVRRIDPLGPGDGHLYLSLGAFQAGGDPAHEFFLLSPGETPRHLETLAMVAHFHSVPRHRLAHGSLVDLGRPWLEGAAARHLLVSWPYALDPRAAECTTAGGPILYLWLIPLLEPEAHLVRTRGVTALEDRLEETGANVLDPHRPSVA